MYQSEEERKRKNTEARTRATKKYQDKVYDKANARFRKGTLARIRATGAESVNSFISRAVYAALESAETLQPRAASATITIEIDAAARAAMERYGKPEEIAAAAVRAAIEECKAGIYTPPDAP